MKDTKIFIGIIILFVGFMIGLSALGVWGYSAYKDSQYDDDGNKVTKYQYECNIKLTRDTVSRDPIFDNVECSRTGSSCGGLFSFSIWSDMFPKGDIEAWDSTGKLASEEYDLGLWSGGTDKITMKVCTGDNEILFKAYDDEHNFVVQETG